ncbi:hypothetical protein [Saccharothrix luteola]|uniref:hypothetical protein n=1 Tax=Saccharothrix luteola TaxID=2893018 RepID=UPI001E5341B8|nr:hypothetical protein [Saccharothrix luteola]MCC8243257.1 hypothetical protein [Saccharothrix luteola]
MLSAVVVTSSQDGEVGDVDTGTDTDDEDGCGCDEDDRGTDDDGDVDEDNDGGDDSGAVDDVTGATTSTVANSNTVDGCRNADGRTQPSHETVALPSGAFSGTVSDTTRGVTFPGSRVRQPPAGNSPKYTWQVSGTCHVPVVVQP